jgi:CDP-diacylglycerol--glycerol-3-phosphate 3-phosphatidyltransferase
MRLQDLYNAAGALTASRLAFAALMPFVLPGRWGLLFYLLAIATDVVDGMVARRTGTASSAGAAFDGWVDKTLHVNLAWSLAVADRIPDWWMLAWFSREIVQVVMHPVLMRRFRLGEGRAPQTSLLGRVTAVTLFAAVVLTLLGYDAFVLTVVTGVFGFAAGVHYGWLHLVAGATAQPPSGVG